MTTAELTSRIASAKTQRRDATSRAARASTRASPRQRQQGLVKRTDLVDRVAGATAQELLAMERGNVPAADVKALAAQLDLPVVRLVKLLAVPKSTLEKRAAAGEPLGPRGATAAVGLAKLVAQVRAQIDSSTSPAAATVDAASWLGQWLLEPQAALGGACPADVIDTPSGLASVSRLLGAMASGAYQ